MSRSKRGGIVAAVLLVVLSLAAAAFAATITPKNGTFKGTTPKYMTESGKSLSSSMKLTVARHKVSGAELSTQNYGGLPIDTSTSKNYKGWCIANSISTQGMKRSGSIKPTGYFSYKWVQTTSSGTSTVKVVGHFVSPRKAVGTFRSIDNITTLKTVCDTGKVKFTVKHS